MKIPISVMTIILILFTLVSFSMYQMYYGLFNVTKNLCEELKPNSFVNASEGVMDSWGYCMLNQQDMHAKWGLTMVVTLIFFFMALLSWRIDILEKRKR